MKEKRLFIEDIAGKGRGVFCFDPIGRGETIETCRLILVDTEASPGMLHSELFNYVFRYGSDPEVLALALGYGSLYNHATDSNAEFHFDRQRECIVFTALADIPAGCEICINYAGEQGKEYDDWFRERGLACMPPARAAQSPLAALRHRVGSWFSRGKQ